MNETALTKRATPALRAALFMVLAGGIFSLVNISIQFVTMRLGMASTNVVFWQYFIATLFSIPIIIKFGITGLRTTYMRQHLLRVFLAVLGIQFWAWGLTHVPIWQAIALVMTSPFFVTFGARFILRENVSPARWLATAAGFIGGLIILSPWSDAFSSYTCLPLVAAMLWAGASIMTKRLTRHEGAEKVTIYLLALLTPINAGLALGAGTLALPTQAAIGLVIGAGLLTALAQWLLASAYETADASYVQPFDHLKLPFNVLAGWLVFGFIPEGNLWLGATLIIAASLFIVHREAKEA